MVQEVVRLPLAVGEDLRICKNRVGSGGKRICIVTGTHGDELEGQYVAWRLNRILAKNPNYLQGTVDIYPAMNPLGISTMTRGIPLCDLDMNRTFPGSENGSMSEFVAARLVRICRGQTPAWTSTPATSICRKSPRCGSTSTPLKSWCPWPTAQHGLHLGPCSRHRLESTLAHSLNALGTPTLVVEMGVGNRLTPAYGDQLLVGLLNLDGLSGGLDRAGQARSGNPSSAPTTTSPSSTPPAPAFSSPRWSTTPCEAAAGAGPDCRSPHW